MPTKKDCKVEENTLEPDVMQASSFEPKLERTNAEMLVSESLLLLRDRTMAEEHNDAVAEQHNSNSKKEKGIQVLYI